MTPDRQVFTDALADACGTRRTTPESHAARQLVIALYDAKQAECDTLRVSYDGAVAFGLAESNAARAECDRLREALGDLAYCVGSGPESDAWWEARLPEWENSPTSTTIRDAVLDRALALLTERITP